MNAPMDTGTAARVPSRWAVWLWGAAFFFGMFGAGFLAKGLHLGAVPSMLIIMVPMLLLIPFVRATERAQASCGSSSPAMVRYNRRAMVWSFGYVVLLFAGITGSKVLNAHGPFLWFLAVLPGLPILYLLWAMGRYLAEEQDEYLRMRAVQSALWATGLLLGSATVWGFLESFALVPHVPSWAAVPVWAVGLGLGTFVNRWRDK